jgi:hypothetical protein
MRLSSTVLVQFVLVVLIAAAVSGWFLTVPKLLTASTYVAFAGLLGGCLWVTAQTYINGRPAASMAQSLHDAAGVDAERVSRIG